MQPYHWLMLAAIGVWALMVCGAVFLAYHHRPGWGWLVFLAFLMTVGISIRRDEDRTRMQVVHPLPSPSENALP